MLILINRAHYVEVRKGHESLFRKQKPPEGGIARHVLAALKVSDRSRGVYAIRDMDADSRAAFEGHVREINTLDGRVPEDQDRLNQSLRVIISLDKEVEKVA